MYDAAGGRRIKGCCVAAPFVRSSLFAAWQAARHLIA
jgi:hypothetical protein